MLKATLQLFGQAYKSPLSMNSKLKKVNKTKLAKLEPFQFQKPFQLNIHHISCFRSIVTFLFWCQVLY